MEVFAFFEHAYVNDCFSPIEFINYIYIIVIYIFCNYEIK